MLALIAALVLLIVSVLAVNDNMNAKERVYKLINNEIQDVIWDLNDMESRSAQTVYSLFKLLEGDVLLPEDTAYIKLTELWTDYMQGYEVLHGLRASLKNGVNITFSRTAKDRYILVVLNEADRKRANIMSLVTINGKLQVKDTWCKLLTDKEYQEDWAFKGRVDNEKLSFSNFYMSPLLNESVLSIYKSNVDVNHEVKSLSLIISLDALVSNLNKTVSKHNFVILTDDNSNMTISSWSNSFLKNNVPSLKEDVVNHFLNLTSKKNHYPVDAQTFRYEGIRYLGQWSSFRLGNKRYRMGYVMQCQMANHALIYSLITVVISLVIIVLVVLIVQDKQMRRRLPGVEPEIKSTLSNELIESEEEERKLSELFNRIVDYFEESKVYLKPDCSLGLISEHLGEDREDITKAVDLQGYESVRELINNFRINQAVAFFDSDDYVRCAYSIDYLATQFGYNSRTTFYREFKKRTNYSPAEYQMLKSTSETS